MAQVMEGQAFDASRSTDTLKGLGDRARTHAPHAAIYAHGERFRRGLFIRTQKDEVPLRLSVLGPS